MRQILQACPVCYFSALCLLVHACLEVIFYWQQNPWLIPKCPKSVPLFPTLFSKCLRTRPVGQDLLAELSQRYYVQELTRFDFPSTSWVLLYATYQLFPIKILNSFLNLVEWCQKKILMQIISVTFSEKCFKYCMILKQRNCEQLISWNLKNYWIKKWLIAIGTNRLQLENKHPSNSTYSIDLHQ